MYVSVYIVLPPRFLCNLFELNFTNLLRKSFIFISGIVFAQRPSHTRDTANKKQGLQLSPQTLFLCIGKDYFAAYAAAFTPAIPPKTTSTVIGFAPLVPT